MKGKRGRSRVAVGRASYSVAAERTGSLTIKLDAAARALLKARKKLTVVLTVSADGLPARTYTLVLS